MSPESPRDRSGYAPEDVEQVKSACLTIVSILGSYLDGLCVIGGLVPLLLIDLKQGLPRDEAGHPGSTDLDVALAIALLDDGRYEEIRDQLVASGFGPDMKTATGKPVVHRWRMGELKVTIDWLIAATPEHPPGTTHHLGGDLGAIAMPGIDLALNERIDVTLDGTTLSGHRLARTVPVCGPGAFTVLKSLAIAGPSHRDKPKDDYDLVYVIRRYEGTPQSIADALDRHAATHRQLVRDALNGLANDFASPDHQGPRYVADFDLLTDEEHDQAAADAHGYVDELLKECSRRGLL
jgi:predicted nucleotidyltransferase